MIASLITYFAVVQPIQRSRRIPNEEVLDAAKANSDMMIAFGSVDPHKGKMGLREVKRLIAEDRKSTRLNSSHT